MGAGAAECSLYLHGGESGIIRHAGLRCTGPRPTIALAAEHMAGFQTNFTGVAINSSCNFDFSRDGGSSPPQCLVTICGGQLLLKSSRVLRIQGIGMQSATAVCVAGDSRVEVHNSRFADNRIRPLAVFGAAHLVLNASTVSNNSVNGTVGFSTTASAGGLLILGSANVTITGRSSVHGNSAPQAGGGLVVQGKATLRVDGSSNVSRNSAGGQGGGVYAVENVTVTFDGGSSVHNNTAQVAGGGLSVSNSASATLTGGSSVHSNTAAITGGGVDVHTNATVTVTGGSSVRGNHARFGGGGLAVRFGARLTVSNDSTIVENVCNRCLGGGIAVDTFEGASARFDGRGLIAGREVATGDVDLSTIPASHVAISNSIVANNTCYNSAGGGFAIADRGTVELVDGTVVEHNSAFNGSGGAVVLLYNGTLRTDESVVFVDNSAGKGYIGSTIAAFDNSTLQLRGNLTKCSVGVYLGWFPCRAGEVRQHDMCVCCGQHTFSFSNITCERCPRNANCTEGNRVEPLPGFWSSAATSVQMHRCPLSDTACNYTRPRRDSQVAMRCNEGAGYTGPLCGACKLPDFGMLSPFRCGKCMRPSVQLGLYMLVSFVSVFFVLSTVHATWRDNLTGKKVVLDTDLIKVLVQFLQYTVIIGSVAVPWPLFDAVQRWFQAVNIVFAVGSGQALSLDCWLHHYIPQGRLPLAMQRQLVYFLAPVLVLVAVVALQWLVWALGRWVVPLVWRPKEGRAQRPASLVLRKLPVTLLVLTFYAYPTLLRAALSFFACLVIDRDVYLPSGATAPLNHTHGYWVSDITQQCFAGYHWGWALGLGLPSVLLWCIAVPVALGVGLFVFRGKADSDSFREHFGFLYRSYRPERMWWEAVWAARTVILTCISVFSLPMERYFAVLSLLVVFLVSAALQSIFQPYAFAKLHRMHMVSTSCLLATTLGALAMFAYDIQEKTAQKLRIAIAVLVLLVNVAFVGWCLWKLVPVVREWCVSSCKMVKSAVLWVVAAATGCAGRKSAGKGRGRGRRGGA